MRGIRTSAVGAVAAALVATAVGCATQTTATQGPSMAPAAAAKGPSSSSSPRPSPPASGKGASGVFTFPPAAAGGSAITLTTPCDSGTMTLSAHGDGAGVTGTATLNHVAHEKWLSDMTVTPYVPPGGPPPLDAHTAHHGSLVISATNVTGPGAGRAGVDYAWPQQVGIQLMGKRNGGDCSESAYLSSTRVAVDTDDVAVNVLQAASTIKVYDSAVSRGTWHVTVDARTATGVQHRAIDAPAKYLVYGGVPGHEVDLTFKDFTDLSDFTTINVTIAKTDGSHRTWMRVIRTP